MTACKICESPAAVIGSLKVLGKYPATYLRCGSCGFVWVDSPDWLEEAYSRAISGLDTGIVVRNLWLRDATSALLGTSLRDVRHILDCGGGTGLFVRLMRDRGHDVWWSDAHCANLLAVGFDAEQGRRFDLVTAFELVEHLVDPLDELRKMRALAPRLLLSTELQPRDPAEFFAWHYVAPETGQHIGFFSRRSLEVAAERLGLKLSSNGLNLHLLAEDRISERWLRALRKPSRAAMWAWLGKRKALTRPDAASQIVRLRTLQGEPARRQD